MWDKAVWIGIPEQMLQNRKQSLCDLTGTFAYFRYQTMISENARLSVCITANSRYRLWVNDRPVLSGPCKGDKYRHYYEEVDLSSYLKPGKNTFAVQVLLCDITNISSEEDERTPIMSVVSTPAGHRLAVEGTIKSETGEVLGTVTTGEADWKVYLEDSYYLKSKGVNIYLGGITEEIDFSQVSCRWKTEQYSDAAWMSARMIAPVGQSQFAKRVGFYPKFPIREREIPLLYEKEIHVLKELGEEKNIQNEEIIVAPHTKKTVLLDAGAIYNAYMSYTFLKGAGGKAAFTYFERFENSEKEIRKSDYKNGEITGLTDEIILPEIGADGSDFRYEPFWVRTLRFLRITITAGDEAVVLKVPRMIQTGYPLEVSSEISSSEAWVEQLWNICVRTLKNCMLETYMDCPFYEQMQFIMDTRLQALFTFAVSDDIRLAKKALKDFHCSMIPEGLIQGKYPSSYPQIISTFSLYYIFFLYDFYRQTGDVQTVKRYRADVDTILEYYDRKIGCNGLVENLGFWEFVDWQPEAWADSYGQPLATLTGPSTIINMMYGYALQCGAYLNEKSGREGMAQEYRARQKQILDQLQIRCWSEKRGMYKEGITLEQYTQHAQAWAVMNGMVHGEAAREMMLHAMHDADVVSCTFATGYEIFRALEKTGLYGETEMLMDKWIHLIDLDCTTCPEEPVNGRSECHAWSALPIYEMMRCVAGVRMGEDGWKSLRIRPYLGRLNDVKGKAMTPKGAVEFSYEKNENGIEYRVKVPENMPGEFIDGNGKRYALQSGDNVIYEARGIKIKRCGK